MVLVVWEETRTCDGSCTSTSNPFNPDAPDPNSLYGNACSTPKTKCLYLPKSFDESE